MRVLLPGLVQVKIAVSVCLEPEESGGTAKLLESESNTACVVEGEVAFAWPVFMVVIFAVKLYPTNTMPCDWI